MVSMKDIAEAVGVSRSTVSLVLNGRYQRDLKISDAVAERVKKAAARMKYRRNAVADAMKQGRTRVIGFIGNLGEVGHNYVLNMITGASKTLQRHGYLLKMFALDGGDFSALCRNCVEQRLDGVIARFLPEEQLDVLHRELSAYHIPVVILGNSFPNKHYARVISDDASGCEMALRHLASLGHERIGFLTREGPWGVMALRKNGYLEGMKELGLAAPADPILTLKQATTMEDGDYAAFDAFFAGDRFTAMLCSSDSLAMKLLVWAHKRGVAVPGKLSVVGFGNEDHAAIISPPLSTIAHPYERMGERCAGKMLELIESGQVQEDESLPVRLVVRESTGPYSGAGPFSFKGNV